MRLVQDLLRILDSLQLPLIGESADPRQQQRSLIRSDICVCRPLVAAQRRRACSLSIYSSWVSCSNRDRRQSIPTMGWIYDLFLPFIRLRDAFFWQDTTSRSFAAGGPLGLVASGRTMHKDI